jgi:Immunity protein 35
MIRDERHALQICDEFLSAKSESIGTDLVKISFQKIEQGWLFYYNSRTFVEHGNDSDCLVGQGPTIVLRSGQVIEGGSSESVEAVLQRHRLL